jgi:ubiquinone/menaquinone biosynthesis C-methylase UbiE
MWSDRELRLLDENKVLGRNWASQWQYALAHKDYLEMCKRIVSTGGPILEVAAGPGGGNLSPIKHLDPTVQVIVNDVESQILTRWEHYLREHHPSLTVSFAPFDVCSMPLANSSVACISSAGGLGTMLGSHEQALHECARVLRPGGIVACLEMSITEGCLDQLPRAFLDALVYHPWLFRDWNRLFQSANLTILSDISIEKRTLKPLQSALAGDAALFGASLEVEFRAIVAEKQLSGASRQAGQT